MTTPSLSWAGSALRADRASEPVLWAMGVILFGFAAIGPTLHHRFGAAAHMGLIAVWAIAAAYAASIAGAAETRRALWIILVAALAMRGAMLFAYPYLSTDIWRYVWDGRVQGAGINPYRYLPVAPELAHLRDAAIYPNINRATYAPTVYPPAAQMAFWLITRFSDSMIAMKAGMVVFEGLAVASLIAILARLGRPLTAVAAYAWHPLPIWEIAGNGHVDAVMTAFVMLGLWAYLAGRVSLAGVLAVAGALAKPTALLALPVFWAPRNWRLVAVVAAACGLLYLPYLSVGWQALGFAAGYAREEGLADGRGFWLLQVVRWPLGVVDPKFYYVLAAGLIGGLALRVGFRSDRSPAASIAALHWLLVAFLLLLSTNYPWYFVVLAPFCVLTRYVTPWLLTVAAVVLYDVIPGDTTALPATAAKLLFYGAGVAAAIYDLGFSSRAGHRLASGEAIA